MHRQQFTSYWLHAAIGGQHFPPYFQWVIERRALRFTIYLRTILYTIYAGAEYFLEFPHFRYIYPEIRATEVTFLALKYLPVWLLFQDIEVQLEESKETHCICSSSI